MQVISARNAFFFGACALAFALIAPLRGFAQDDPNATTTAAGGLGVARISLIEGAVSVQRGDSNDPLTAAPNTPVLAGDYVTTGDSSRAEIQLDGYSQVRLDHDAQMRFTYLGTKKRRLQLAAGTLELRLMRGRDGSSEIDTPSVSIKPQAGGKYRVTVTADGQTQVTVRSGDAEIETPQGTQDLAPGFTVIAQGDAASPSVQSQVAVNLDDFDRFNADRDQADAPAIASAGFINPDIGGTVDLAANGRWVSDGSYGNVWVPAVGADWAPYRDGRWAWEEGYGWTWIANESWGWAPYHYGSWYNSPNYGWCWYPPQPQVFVPWRPALVAFIGLGGGSGFSLNFGGGNAIGQIGWVPLAPFEPYHPWWNNRYAGGAVVNNVTNVTNVTNITNVTNVNVYKNVQYNAVSGVSSQQFLQGNFTHNVALTPNQLRGAQVFRGALPVVPTAANLRFSSSTAAPLAVVHPDLMQRSFAGQPVALRRTPFAAQRVALATATRAELTPLHFQDAQTTPLVPQRSTEGAPAQGVHTNASVVHPGPAGDSTGAWNRFNAARAQNEATTRVQNDTPTRVNETPGRFNETPARVVVPVEPNVRYVAPGAPDALHTAHEPNLPHTAQAADGMHAPRADSVRLPRAAETVHAPHSPATTEEKHPSNVPHAARTSGHATEKDRTH